MNRCCIIIFCDDSSLFDVTLCCESKYLSFSVFIMKFFPGVQALKQIGSVIRNPEIQAISSVLLNALADPSLNTSKCLSTLLKTK